MRKDEIERLQREVEELREIKRRQALGESTPEDEARLAAGRSETSIEFVGAAVALAVLVLGLGWWFAGADEREEERQAKREAAAERREARRNDPAVQRRSAVHVCQQFVTERLRDPDSARFPSGAAQIVDPGKFEVAGVVVARNAFGGMADQPYHCELALTDRHWRAISIRIGD